MRAPAEQGLPGLREEAVSEWVAAQVTRLRGPFGFTRVGGGRSNLTYLARDADGAVVVIRRPPLGDKLESAHDVLREYRLLVKLEPLGLPVPRPLAACEDPEVTGAPFYVMERISGALVDTAEAARMMLERPARERSGVSIPLALAALHDVDIGATGIDQMARGDDHAGRQLRRWVRQWEISKTRELPVIDEVLEGLQGNLPEQTETTLVHGDFTPNNLLLGPEDGEVAAILDWEMWTLGDPVSDLAWMGVWWPADQSRSPLGTPLPPAAGGVVAAPEMIATYAERTGRGLERMPFWTTISYLKLAIILEGIFRRWRDEPASRLSDGDLRPRIDAMANLARETFETQ